MTRQAHLGVALGWLSLLLLCGEPLFFLENAEGRAWLEDGVQR
jgi:hypothetical protein